MPLLAIVGRSAGNGYYYQQEDELDWGLGKTISSIGSLPVEYKHRTATQQ